MALVRVCYVAIRKSKTCSGSFGSRAGTLSKYVISNCWSRLPQKSSHVNANLSGQGPSILLRKTVLSLKSSTGAFIAPLHFANANLSGRGPSILLRKTVLSLKSPTGAFIAALRKRELLKARCFRQLARKHKGNFGKKREGRTVPALLTEL